VEQSLDLLSKRREISAQAFSEQKYASGRECSQSFKLAMLDWIRRDRALTILDVGCGSGEISAHLAALGHRLSGIDISPTAINKYSGRGFRGMVGDLEKGIPAAPGAFDLIWCSEVIEHLQHPEFLLSECRRLLKPQGQLILSTPNSGYYVYRLLRAVGFQWEKLQHPGHRHFFTYSSLIRLLQRCGFEVTDSLGHNVYLAIPDKPLLRLSAPLFSNHKIADFMKAAGFKFEEGLIHGNKWVWSNFAHLGKSLFSVSIMIKGRKN
jgi:2-polyprenyl-3-methyl-5-hydroxy-6-metoxy-1,4-benzoquinol methylase